MSHTKLYTMPIMLLVTTWLGCYTLHNTALFGTAQTGSHVYINLKLRKVIIQARQVRQATMLVLVVSNPLKVVVVVVVVFAVVVTIDIVFAVVVVIIIGPRNLTLNYGQNQVSNS